MADKNIGQFTEAVTRLGGMIIYVGSPSGGGFIDRYITASNFIDGLQLESEKGQANGYASLGADSKLPAAQLPAIAIVEYLGTAANQAAMLALTGEKGDWCVRTDLSTVWVITGDDPSVLGDWTELSYPTAPVTSVNGEVGVVVLDASNIDETASRVWLTTAAQTIAGAKTFSSAVVGNRGSSTENASLSIRSANANTRLYMDITGAVTITVDDTSNSEIGTDTEIEVVWTSDSGSNSVTFAATGSQSIISEDSNLSLSKVGSGAVLIKKANNTWVLIGSLS